jgi:hypothetical protein
MKVNFENIRTTAHWIAPASALAAFVCWQIAFDVVVDLRLTALFFFAWIGLSLLALASAPFAVMMLMELIQNDASRSPVALRSQEYRPSHHFAQRNWFRARRAQYYCTSRREPSASGVADPSGPQND